MNSNFEFQTSLLNLVINSSPNLFDFQKHELTEILESLATAHKLLNQQSDELLPS